MQRNSSVLCLLIVVRNALVIKSYCNCNYDYAALTFFWPLYHKFNAYTMPRSEELIDIVGPAQVISSMDLAKGYWQILMDQGSTDKTA